jgi:hypothetical protein
MKAVVLTLPAIRVASVAAADTARWLEEDDMC